ncbi:hypothetical protein J7T55_001002 [Diaporthe amygdali]|uniref:uncharacterized protein n=1 Tax=Phomopsis amygdali TaxID=1214568 RepID=UPI0022FDC339|nr:uncharacterized protein J7T55_001002 [Diaporthe amygdali]KAJ0120147.1 hypothetical protein J7T55_001002 [Diaporthe amygdali]
MITTNDRPADRRRFTTLEGWREVGRGVYLAAGSTVSSVAFEPNQVPRYDSEWGRFDDNESIKTRLSRPEEQRRASSLAPSSLRRFSSRSLANPFISPEEVEEEQSFAGSNPQDEIVEAEQRPRSEQPFHIFSKKQKWVVVAIIGVAGLFSGLSSNIYFPSLDAIAQDLRVSLTDVSLTITSYLVIQGISPLFWGPLSDTLGRRPIYIASFSVYILANIILSFSPNFPVLLVARGLQSAGSASTVSIGNGVIQDIATPLERGSFIGFYQAIRNFSIAVGPVIGGLLANFLGFRSIFVFLTILSGLVLIMLLIYLPETLRTIAGNGSLRLSGVYQPLIRRILKEPKYMEDPGEKPEVEKVTLKTFIAPLKLLAQKDILALLVSGGMVYTIWSMVVASTTGIFKERFVLNELMLGLAFLPNGFGTIVGSYIAGKLMTRDFIRYEQQYLETHPGAPAPSKSKKSLAPDFPIEHARLGYMPWITLIFVISTAIYGFTVLPTDLLPPQAAHPAWIALPLFLQFLIAATSNAVFAINTTLVSDLCPGKGASSTAINNLMRCSMAAVGVGVVESMLALVGRAGTFVALAFLVLSMSVLNAVEWYWGMQWRNEREMKKNIEKV